jgi:hypothetical protein
VVGVEDGSFQKGITPQALLAAVLLKELQIERVQIMKIAVDGLDATQKLVKTLRGWKFRAVMLAGVSLQDLTSLIQRLFMKNSENQLFNITNKTRQQSSKTSPTVSF